MGDLGCLGSWFREKPAEAEVDYHIRPGFYKPSYQCGPGFYKPSYQCSSGTAIAMTSVVQVKDSYRKKHCDFTARFIFLSRSTDWRQDVCIKSNGMLLARIGSGVVSWKHDIAGDRHFFDLDFCVVASRDVCLAAVDFGNCTSQFVVACNGCLVRGDASQPVAIRATDAS